MPNAGDDRRVPGWDTGTDLHSLYIEMAALRSEVRRQSRLVKDTLDLVRDVVERAETERARVADWSARRPC